MKFKAQILLPISLSLVVLALTWMLAMAESPARIESEQDFPAPSEPTAVQMPEPAKPEEASKPEEPVASLDSFEGLAPESFAQDMEMDMGFGAAYGAGGSGPALASGDGASNPFQMIRQASEVDRMPRLISRSLLDYPSEAKSKGIKGHVSVRLYIGPSGQVEDIQITESEPKGIFDQVVLKSVRGWRFEPGLSKGQVASMWIGQKIKFELE